MERAEEQIAKLPPHNEEEFTILYDKVKKQKARVHEVLPDWLTSAHRVEASFEHSVRLKKVPQLSHSLRAALSNMEYSKLFPVQQSVLEAFVECEKSCNFMRPRDICVCAPTGSGKTLAYIIPLLQSLSKDTEAKIGGPRAVIVLPVRDLALQVYNVCNSVAKSLSGALTCALITGQKNLSEERKDLLQEGGVDVLVCTPGRLVDHIRNTKQLDLSRLRLLVIDEADRVLEEHKHDWYNSLTLAMGVSSKPLRNIDSCFVNSSQQQHLHKILLSATLTREPHLLEHFDLHYPQLFIVGGGAGGGDKATGSDTTTTTNSSSQPEESGAVVSACGPQSLQDHYVVCQRQYSKILFLVHLVRQHRQTKILCFTNTRDSASRLHLLLSHFKQVRTAYLSCQLPLKARAKLRHDFEQGRLDVLVTVDSMGRGMDLEGVQVVVQYDIASKVHTHIHRVGRTARGGAEGLAYALCAEKEVFHLKKSLRECGRTIRQLKFPPEKCYKYMNEYNTVLALLQNNQDNNNNEEDNKEEHDNDNMMDES